MRAAFPSSCGVAAAIGALATAALCPPVVKAQTSTISFTGGTYSQDFNGLPTTGQFTNTASNIYDLTDPALGATNVTGWYVGKTNGTNNALFRASDGTGGIFSGAAYSWGGSNSTDRALGSLASGTTIPNFGAIFVNNSGSTLTQFTLSYTGEQWRLGSGPANMLTFGYNLGGTSILDSGFTNVAALNFTAPNVPNTGTTNFANLALNGNAASNRVAITSTVIGLNWAPGQTLIIRWNDANDTGNDDGLGVDDLTFSAIAFVGRNLVYAPNPGNAFNTTDPNFTANGSPTTFASGDNVFFGDNGVGTVNVDAGGVTPGSVTVSNSAGTYSFTGGPIAGPGPLAKSGDGTLVLSATNLYSGGTFLNGGVLVIGSNAVLGAPNGALTFDGGTLRTTGSVTSGRSVIFNPGGGTIDTNGFDSTFTGGFSGTGGFTKTGLGNLKLTGAFNFAGTTLVTAGALVFAQPSGSYNFNAPDSGTNFTGDIVIATPIRLAINGGVVDGGGQGAIKVLTDGTGIAATVSGRSATINNPILLNANNVAGPFVTHVGANAGASLILNAPISGNADLDLASANTGGGAGVVRLNVPNTYTGSTFVNNSFNGIVRLGVANALPTNTTVTFGTEANAGPGTLDLNGFDQTIAGLATGPTAGTNAVNARITNNGFNPVTLTVSGAASTIYSGVLNDGGGGLALMKDGPGTLAFTGTAQAFYSLGTTISGGTISFVADENLGLATSVVNIGAGTLLAASNITTARPIVLNDAASALDAADGNTLTITTDLSGPGSLTKGASAGTVVLAQTSAVSLPNLTANGGTLFIGGSGGLPAPLTVNGTLAINNGATVRLAPAASRVTGNFAKQLSIGTNGLLDLGNHFLMVDNTATPESAVRQYLKNGYNADPNTGIGDWNGRGGITSSDAIAAHNGPNPSFKISIGYVNGAYRNDPLINAPIPGQETLPTNRTLIRPALYGDLNLDGKVDDTDLQIFSGLGQYNQPSDRFGWLGGDLNHDGRVDDTDLQIFSGAGNYNGPSYAAAAASHAVTSKLSAGGGGAMVAVTTEGGFQDGHFDFYGEPELDGYFHLFIRYDGDPHITAAAPLQVIRLNSAGGKFIFQNFKQDVFNGGVTANAFTLNGTVLGAGSIPDGYDLGAILPFAVTRSELYADLTLQWNVFGGGIALRQGDLYISPEPTTLGLIGMSAVGLLARRRKRRGVQQG